MGYAISWYAVPEENADSFLSRLHLVPTGETEDFPESLLSTAKLDTGWRLLWYNRYGCPFLRDKEIATISNDHDLVVTLVEEHVMASSSAFWSGGSCRWAISHDGEDGPKGLSTHGDLPDCFPSIRVNMEQRQQEEGGDTADVDYIFEIPLSVTREIVGFKHDEECSHLTEGHFIVLDRSHNDRSEKSENRGFIRRLFGT